MMQMINEEDGISLDVIKMFMRDVIDKGIVASNARHKTGGKRYNEVKENGRKRGRPRNNEYGVDPRLPGKVVVSYM